MKTLDRSGDDHHDHGQAVFLRTTRAMSFVFILCLAIGLISSPVSALTTPDPTPPASPVKVIFIHHSTGEAWLADGYGNLGTALRDNGYFVSDTNYGWGPDSIGDRTDVGHWWDWFRGPSHETILAALFAESDQHSSYSRLAGDPGGENTIIMFKSCFPNSALGGDPGAVVPAIESNPLKSQSCGSDAHTVANAKGIYIDLLPYFASRPDKLFVVITAPPLSDPTDAANARAFNEWLVHDWLSGYYQDNVFVFDYYTVLTTNGGSANINDLGALTGNHHRFRDEFIEHISNGDNDSNPNVSEYSSAVGDDHPRSAGDLKATGEFLPLLNIAYNQWKAGGPDGAAIFRNSTGLWMMDYNNDGVANATFSFGIAGDIPIVGHWNEPLIENAGVFRPSNNRWYLDYNRNSVVDAVVTFGLTGDTPIIGDWNGDGLDDIGVFRSSNNRWYLDYNKDGIPDAVITFGLAGDVPIIGDWSGDGLDDIGVFRSSNNRWYLDYNNNGAPDVVLQFGIAGDTPVIGDWNGDGLDDIGVFRSPNQRWYLDYNRNGAVDAAFQFGLATDTPVIGDWNGDDMSDAGMFRPSSRNWYLDYNKDSVVEKTLHLGIAGDMPKVGRWI